MHNDPIQHAGAKRRRIIGVGSQSQWSGVGTGHAHCAEHRGEIAFFSCGVDETAGCECRRVQSAETASRDDEGEDQRADGAEDAGAECYGDGVGRGDCFVREDEGVGEGCEEVGEYDEGHGRVDDSW